MSTESHLPPPSNDDGNYDDIDTQAGEYVLGTLDGAERHAMHIRLPHDPALRAAVDAWEVRLHPLTRGVAPVQPSAAVWQRIAATTAQAHPSSSTRQAAAPRWWQWDSLALWRGLAGTGLTAAAVLCAMLLAGPAPQPAAARYFVVLAAPQNQAPGWLVQAQAAGNLRLVPLSPDVIPAEKSLQFWTKADSWSAPVSLGLVTPGQAIEVPVDQLPPLQPNQLFELTLEPAGGSPIDRPTGPIQFIGRAVQL